MSDDERRNPKRSRHMGDFEARLLIASRHAGSIIGKGGAIISKLRSEHQANINIPDCPGPERVVSMSGTEGNVCKLAEAVVQALDDSMPVKGETDVRILLHQSQCGAIIGKGGSRVKELREVCGGQVKVFQGPCPQSTDRVVQITGETDRVSVTVTHVLEAIAQCPIKGMDTPYNPFNADEMFAHEYGGWGDPNKSRGFGPPPPPMGDFRGRGPMGPPMGGHMGGANRVPVGPGGPMGPGMNQPWGGGPGPRNRRSGNSFSRDEYEEEGPRGGGRYHHGNGQSLMATNSENLTTTTQQVTIPKDSAGAIIGKAGQRIRRIRFESECTISIEDARPGSDDRIITITGTEQQIKHAQYLLQQSVRQYGPSFNNSGDQRF